MRIQQARVSNSVSAFRDLYLRKYRLSLGKNINKPIVMFGMYSSADYMHYTAHKDHLVVVWCGSDSKMINRERAAIIKSRPAVHIVKSHYMSEDLDIYGIPHRVLPITWQIPTIDPVPRGDNVYHYGNGKTNFYGDQYLSEIFRRTEYSIIKATHTTYTREELMKVYASCFVGLRLTRHDGLPNTVLELGMMGRRCIYNGDLPNAIPWQTMDDICKGVIMEYVHKDRDDTKEVSEAVKDYINIGEEWLHVE